jgi:hypothetical protein
MRFAQLQDRSRTGPSHRRPSVRTALIVVLVLAATGAAAPSAAEATTYGIADAEGTFASCSSYDYPCSAGSVGGYWSNAWFQLLYGSSSAHTLGSVRLFVDYDAVYAWNGSTTSPGCVYSNPLQYSWQDQSGSNHPAGQSWYDLFYGLQEAAADHLTPLVSIGGYGSIHANSWDPATPDPTTVSGYWQYYCGVAGIVSAINYWNSNGAIPAAGVPHEWEAFNEPDGTSTYNGNANSEDWNCDTSNNGNVDGAGKAACDWIIAHNTIHAYSGHSTDTVAAGVFHAPSGATGSCITYNYMCAYANMLVSQGYYPPTWAVHDYNDVTASTINGSTHPLLKSFDSALYADTAQTASSIWVTEAATRLDDPDRTYNGQGVNCAATPGDTDNNGGTLGACVDENAYAQTTAAQNFFTLPDVYTYGGAPIPVTQIFWYQLIGNSIGWDSGMWDGNSSGRAPYCVWYGINASNCTGNAADAWTANPPSNGN